MIRLIRDDPRNFGTVSAKAAMFVIALLALCVSCPAAELTMAAVKSGDVVLPTRASNGSVGPTLTIRCVTRPDAHTEVLLNRLGIELPNHLKRECPTTPAASEVCMM